MKSAMKAVVVFALFGAVLAHAQSNPGQFQHVIIVIQENRTPDNLFAGIPPLQQHWTGPWFEAGVDLAIAPSVNGGQPGQPWCLGACFDPGHSNIDWQTQYTNEVPSQTKHPHQCGNSSGLVTYCSSSGGDALHPRPVCGTDVHGNQWTGCSLPNTTPIPVPDWPEESYVSYDYDQVYTQNGGHVLDPYASIALQYGFANYFYQTNQGPSEPAHDFLFGGTSASTGDPSQLYYNYFVAENPSSTPDGCEGTQQLPLIDPYGHNPAGFVPPCLEHQTMTDLLENKGLSWKYYTGGPNLIWTAPNAIGHICLPLSNGHCNNTDFTSNVLAPNNFFKDFPSGGTNLSATQQPCTLPSVAWIVPDGRNSDHPGIGSTHTYSTDIEGGPNWVANIVNAVGNATCYDIVNNQKVSPWTDTVILVVWDDWGGWYDHVMGLSLYEHNSLKLGSICKPTYNNLPWGCGYTYGFRVPFLVVSAYTKDGTVSGFCTQGVDCVGNGNGKWNAAPHQHDFGSILAFVEYNFSLPLGGINLAKGFPFADYYAPEVVAPPPGPYPPLGDFFNLTQPKTFEPITTVNNSFTFQYFYNFNGPYDDPDNDIIDND